MKTTNTSAGKMIVMLGIHPASKERGGISSVVEVYRHAGLFARWPIVYIGTVASGSAGHKIRVAAAAFWNYLRVTSTGRVGLVHVHSSSRASFWRKSVFVLLARAARQPVIFHVHSGEFDQFYERECAAIAKAFIRFILNNVTRVVVVSGHLKQFIERIAPGAQVSRIFNPITELREQHDSHGRLDNVVLFLGRFKRSKGIFDLLDALVIVRKQIPSVQLRCGGDGDAASVIARANELGLTDCVHVLGWVSGAAKERELQRAALYVLPSYAEGLPMGVLEAMAAGTPVVASAVGGVPDAITNGADGFLFRAGDVQALADQVLRLLGDAQLRKEFALRAKVKVRDLFSTETVLAQVEDLYRGLGVRPQVPDHIGSAPASTSKRAKCQA